MKKYSKKYQAAKELIKKESYEISEAVELLKDLKVVNFDPSCEAHFNLGLDPRQADQNIRTTVALPNGTGKKVRVVAFVDDSLIKEATDAGAVMAGTEELVAKIEKGWLDFDVAVAAPDQMKNLAKIAKTLGQKRLMPSPKSGTVTTEIGKTISEILKGKIEIRLDKFANVHCVFGKLSFDVKELEENLRLIVKTIVDSKPEKSKGTYVKSIFITTSMGPSIALDVSKTLSSVSE